MTTGVARSTLQARRLDFFRPGSTRDGFAKEAGMMRGGHRLVLAALVAATLGMAGCEGEDVEVDVGPTPTPAPNRTSTPAGSTPVRTATPIVSATPAATATVAGPTSTAGGPTATPGGPTATAGGPTASPTPGTVNAEVTTTVGDLLPFFRVAGLTTGVGSASAQHAARTSRPGIGTATEAAVSVDNCPDGGTRTQDDQLTSITVTLAACKFVDAELGSFQFDGTITANLLAGTAAFNVTTLDTINSRTVTFVGSVTGAPAGGGGFVVNGPVVLTTPQGTFTLTLDDLTVDGDGNVVSGGGTITDDDDNFDLASIQVTIRTGGLLADLLATFDDNSTAAFVVDLQNGEITPAD
jgi:hypothetical protein